MNSGRPGDSHRLVPVPHRPTLAGALCFLALFAGSSGAAEIFRWVDEDGRVHYGDRPRPDAESIEVQPPTIGDEELQRRHRRRQKIVDAYARERHEKAAERATEKAEETAKAEKCDAAKHNLSRFENSARIVQRDNQGNRVVLDGEAYDTAHQQLQGRVKEYCG